MGKSKTNEKDNETLVGMKFVENLYRQGLIEQHTFKNILNKYKDGMDMPEFSYRVLDENKRFYTVEDVMHMLGVSKTTAYREIKQLNDELKQKGYITVSGKVPRKFFEEKFYC